jgi:ubiquinone/menaquinone biosynthesis C-methylase UbiE
MISLYDVFMMPLERSGIVKARKTLIPKANGTVLEIGSGTGVNFKHYNFDNIHKLIMSDKKISKKLKEIAPNHIELLELDVQDLPFVENSFDYIIHSLVFCSVNDVSKGLKEIKRVLKPNGTIIFIEHILPEKRGLKGLFSFINPAWKVFASGCNLTRDYESSLIANGFDITHSTKFMNTAFVYGEAKIQH